jgi:hypothetical protein
MEYVFKYSSISVKSAYCTAKSLGGVISAVSSLEHENKEKVIDKIK